MKTYLITGSCGFIGSNLALRLLNSGARVIGVDRYHSRHDKILSELTINSNYKHYNIDLSNENSLDIISDDVDMIFHLAANADVRFSSVYPDKDLNDGIISTFNVLRWVKQKNIKNIAYASTAALYGDPSVIPTPETYPFIQTSFYGASKLAGEALIQAHCSSYDANAWIFRFCSITGPKYSHGFIYNFYSSLKNNSDELYIHGGQNQRKTYLDIDDCIDAILIIINKTKESVNIFNIGHPDICGLNDSLPIITNYLKINPKIIWSGNEIGWVGDSKISHLDLTKLINLGWSPKYSIPQTITRTLEWLEANKWILDVRKEI